MRKTNLDLIEANTELERFGTIAAHDLQEPVRTIVSFLQLLNLRYPQAFDDQGSQYMGFVIVEAGPL